MKGECDMPRKGFSFGDRLQPKPRDYQPEIYDTARSTKPVLRGKIRALQVLTALKICTPPINLNSINSYLGAYVQEVSSFPECPMAAGRYVGDGKIQIKIGLPETLYRSTLAHELGHLALGHDIRNKWHEIESFSDSDPHENEAWDFAGELLVPDKILKSEFKKNPSPDYLSKMFLVSHSFLWVQLLKRRYKL